MKRWSDLKPGARGTALVLMGIAAAGVFGSIYWRQSGEPNPVPPHRASGSAAPSNFREIGVSPPRLSAQAARSAGPTALTPRSGSARQATFAAPAPSAEPAAAPVSCDGPDDPEAQNFDVAGLVFDDNAWYRVAQAKLSQIHRSMICPGKRRQAPGCLAFVDVMPRPPRPGELYDGRPFFCENTIRHARCIEVIEGFYVPVVRNVWNDCAWTLWFVPKDRRAPLMFRSKEFEGQLQESGEESMDLLDFDGDGEVELVLVHHWCIGGNGNCGTDVFLARPSGEFLKTPFHWVADVDHDGSLDALLDYSFDHDNGPDDDPIIYKAPRLLIHRARGGFSLQDDVARTYRKVACADATNVPVVVHTPDDAIDEQAMFKRSICQVADGAASHPILAAIREACAERDSPFAGPTTTSRGCRNERMIVRTLESLEAVRPWLGGDAELDARGEIDAATSAGAAAAPAPKKRAAAPSTEAPALIAPNSLSAAAPSARDGN